MYAPQGAGTVLRSTEKTVLGRRGTYHEIALVGSRMRVLIPADRTDGLAVRPVVQASELERIAAMLMERDVALPGSWPQRQRMERDIMATGDAYRIAHLIGTLDRRAARLGLADTERAIFNDAMRLLASELALVQSSSLDEAERWIRDRLQPEA